MSLVINHLNFTTKNNKTLLYDVSLRVDSAKVIGIIGPNGAGKSTLMKCLSGLIHTTGQIALNQQSIESYTQPELAQIRAALPQESNLSFPFPAKDVVGMSFAMTAISVEQQEALIDHCLTLVSASELACRNFLSLSGGEKQRVHLARVFAQLLQNPPSEQMRFLMLDEPTAPLDLKHQFQLFSNLKSLVTANITSIVVIHDINLAASYCDEIWVIHQGRLISQKPPGQVISTSMMKSVFDVDISVAHYGQHATPVINNPL